MFGELIDKLRNKRKELVDVSFISDCATEDNDVEIFLDTYKNFWRMQVRDYVSCKVYVEKIDEIDNSGMSNNISMSILWNSVKQKINKGYFYVYTLDNCIYNFWTDGKEIMIDERIQLEKEKNERIMRFDLDSKDYAFTFFKHNSFGSTFYTMYYSTSGMDMGNLMFTKEDAYLEVVPFFERIFAIENVSEIMDVNQVRESVLNDLKPDGVKKEYKNNEEKR